MQLKKSLGQHFLKDETTINRIIAAVAAEAPERLLEVGPGGGALTGKLLKLPGIEFKASELDDEKIEFLTKRYPALQIIPGDFLEMNKPFEGPFSIVGNFPYNISSQILFRVIDWKDDVTSVIGMFQKEVAERVAAGPGSKTYGVLSALIQPWYSIEYLFDVPPAFFDPPPKVMSGVIRLRRKEALIKMRSPEAYKLLVKTAFNRRRKTLRNAVRSLFLPEALTDPIFNKRAEQLSIEDFGSLTFTMQGA